MNEVIGISFKENGKIYYFDQNKYTLKKNVTVLVETERGLQFGKVEIEKIKVNENRFKNMKKVVRIATKEDFEKDQKNIRDASLAFKKCQEIADRLKLKMQVIEASYTFDREQLCFKFISEGRIDFRDLVKELAGLYRTRIDLRQVGIRDKAKEIGGCGMCGRNLCCSTFLNDLDSVSINMAKNQNISLNPSKINGVCGRLLCCLKYEDECYTKCRKCLPALGTRVESKSGTGKVIGVDPLAMSYKLIIPEVGIVEVKADNGSN